VVPSTPERVRWRVRLDGDYSLHRPGVAADGTVYVSMAMGQLYAVAPTGTPSAPAAPSGLSAAAPSARRLDLAWSDNAADETGTRVERCAGRNCTNFRVIAQLGANVTRYTHTAVAPNGRYRYRVQAWNAGGSSIHSNVVGVRTPR
jgi:hypothetical protein